jgi:high affinity cGMP-specific 3',5'-cyclic phosphodiesterase 9
MLFALFRIPELNILCNVSAGDYKEIRKMIINCILATDMGKHAELLGKLREVTANFSLEDANHKMLLFQMLMKCADISNEGRPTKVSEPWVDLLLQEFFAQSDKEKLEGLPFMPFMDREKVTKPNAQGILI